MATGASAQPGRGVVVTNLAPQVDLRDGSAEAWDQTRRVADRFYEAGKVDLVRRAQARGAEEGAAVAAGEMEKPNRGVFWGGDVAAARESALQTAYTARVRSDMDAREADLRREYRYDPEAYERATADMVSGFIQGAPPEFAVDVETYARGLSQRGMENVANLRAERDQAETVQAVTQRRAQLQERMIAMASRPGGIVDPNEYMAANMEYRALQDEAEGNPAIIYSPEMRQADDDQLEVGIQTAVVGVQAVQTYRAGGGGLPGIAAAQRQLREDLLESDTFADMKPELRARLYRDATTQLNQYATADREEARAVAEQERERTAAARDRRDSYSLRIAMGDGVTLDELRSDPMLDDGDRAQLLRASDAAARREASQARTDANLEAQAGRAVYGEYRDQAVAGTLSEADLADAVGAGMVSRGQARTLRSLRDGGLKPIVDDVMAPVRDALRARSSSARGGAEMLTRAEQNAIEWVRNNQNAPLDLRLSVGRDIAARYVGGGAGLGRPPADGAAAAAAAARARQLDALATERDRRSTTGNRMRNSEYNRRRNEIMHGS